MKRKKSIKFYYQLEANDCGPACVQMVCNYYGLKLGLREIKSALKVSKLGVSIKDIRNYLESLGFQTASVKIDLSDIEDMPLPGILFLNHGHYVVIEKIKERRGKKFYYIVDPSFGKLKLNSEIFNAKWLSNSSGLAIALEPKKELEGPKEIIFEKKPLNDNPIWKNVNAVLVKNKGKFLISMLLTLVVLGTNWAMPLLLKESMDQGILMKNIHVVTKVLLIQLLFVLGFLASQSISEILTTKISLDINIDLNKSYFRKILNLPISFHDSKFKSDLIEGLNDQGRINNFISFNLISLATNLMNIIVFSGLLIYHNHEIFLYFIVFSVLSFVYTLFFLKKKKLIDYSLFTLESENRNNVYELIMGISEVKINSAERNRLKNWFLTEEKLKKVKIRSTYVDFLMVDGVSFISKVRDIVLLGFCSYLVIEDTMTIGVMMMITYILGQLAAPFDDIIKQTKNIQRTKLSFDRLTDLYNNKEELDDTKLDLKEISKNEISIRNVSFKYNLSDDEYTLKDLNVEIPEDSIVAIVGESGSGKSTLLKLLLGFYFATEGEILVDDKNINQINLSDWRSFCGVIMQEGYIFSGTVSQNVTLSDEAPNMEKLKFALKVAELENKVNNLPMKHDTKIGEVGISLSGGEKQRLLIARAVYKNPEFVFFDEATSAMDTVNEKNIMNNIMSFLKNRTAIIIAHRLSTIKNADLIIVLKDGRIVERGTHKNLLEMKGEYFKLVENQLS